MSDGHLCAMEIQKHVALGCQAMCTHYVPTYNLVMIAASVGKALDKIIGQCSYIFMLTCMLSAVTLLPLENAFNFS